MALYVLNNALASFVQADLRRIYPWPDLTFTAISGAFSLLKVSVVSPPSPSPVAVLFGGVINSAVEVAVVGGLSDTVVGTDSAGRQVLLSGMGGATAPDRFPGTTRINILYDCEAGAGCSGRGRFAEGTTPDTTVDAPTDVVLYHELVHAFHFQTNGFTGDPRVTGEADALPLENQYRLGRRPPVGQRGGPGGGCNGGPPRSSDGGKATGKCCFTGDTLVTLADGEEKPIKLVREDDLVLGRFGQPNRVVAIERPILGDRRLYSLNGGSPFVTAEHPFMTADGWKAIDPMATRAENPLLVVGRLLANDVLVSLRSCAIAANSSSELLEPEFEPISAANVEAHPADPKTPLYNLMLDGDHTYFANRLLVHNKCFIATAVLESAYENRLKDLRQFRDEVVYGTWRGADFMDRFYACYRAIGPRIAAEITSDTSGRKTLITCAVIPVISYLTLAVQLPAELPVDVDLPGPWRKFFEELRLGLQQWAVDAMPPRVPAESEEAAFVTRYVLRTSEARAAYLESVAVGQATPALQQLLDAAAVNRSNALAAAVEFASDGGATPMSGWLGVAINALALKALRELETVQQVFDAAGSSDVFEIAFISPLRNFIRLSCVMPHDELPLSLPTGWRNPLTVFRNDLDALIGMSLALLASGDSDVAPTARSERGDPSCRS